MIKLKYKLVLGSILLFIGCNEQNKQIADTHVETNDIISIQKQGTFAVGGSVKKSHGTFDPIAHGALILLIKVPKGRPCMVTTRLYSIKFLQNLAIFR